MTAIYRELDVPNFEKIQASLVPYILEKYPTISAFWNSMDYEHMFQTFPEFVSSITQVIGQPPIQAFLLTLPNLDPEKLKQRTGASSIHRDVSVESCRLNWPLLNGPSVETRFFSDDAVEKSQVTMPDGTVYKTFEESTVLDTLRLRVPTVVHVHTIHGLYPTSGPLPRYILTIKFDKDISHLLQ